MDCDVCMQTFNDAERRPKFLPCGHTYCLSCLMQLPAKQCPVDQKVFQLDNLIDNYKLLNAPLKPPRFWCIPCEKAATEECLDSHTVHSLKLQRTKASGPLLEALRQGEADLLGLAGVLDKAAVARQADDCGDWLERHHVDLVAARNRLEDALEADTAAWEQAHRTVLQIELPKTAVQLAADLSSPSSSCSVTVRRAAGGPVAWTGEVRPTEDAAARLLLCRLACSGGLRAPEEQPGRQQEMGDIALLWEDRSNQAEVDGEGSVTFSVGSRVARGPGWRDGDQYDGTPPGPGTVTAVRTEVIRSQGKRIRTTIVNVKWGRTGVIGTHFKEGSTEVLRLLPPELKPHIGSEEEVLDVAAISFCVNIKPKGELLAGTNFSWVRTLLGLHCDVDPGWSLTVLQQAAPRLKALQLVSPQQQHLDAALAMPLLEGLCVCNVTGPQLQQVVRMASLRRLELHCPPDAPLPVLAFPGTAAGLRWLRCGVHPLATALALVRAHADTLEELQLVAASTEPYGCPDLARELVRCGLKELKKIVLLRQYAFEAFCRHDKESCAKQKAHIIASFFCNGGLSVDVLCTECNEGCEAK